MYILKGTVKLTPITKNIYKDIDLTLTEVYKILTELKKLNLLLCPFDKKENVFYTLQSSLSRVEAISFFKIHNKMKLEQMVKDTFTVSQLRKIFRKYKYPTIHTYTKNELVYLVCNIEDESFKQDILPKLIEKYICYLDLNKTCFFLKGNRKEDMIIVSATHNDDRSLAYWTLKTETITNNGNKIKSDFEIDITAMGRNMFINHINKFLCKGQRYTLSLYPGILLLSLLRRSSSNNDKLKVLSTTKVRIDISSFKNIEKEFRLKRKGRTKLDFLIKSINKKAKFNEALKYIDKKFIISKVNVAIGQSIDKKTFMKIGAYLQIDFIRKDFYVCSIRKHKDTNLVQALYQVCGKIDHYIHVV